MGFGLARPLIGNDSTDVAFSAIPLFAIVPSQATRGFRHVAVPLTPLAD